MKMIKKKLTDGYRWLDIWVENYAEGKRKCLMIAAFFLVFLSPVFFVHKELDTDFWFLAASGRYILSDGFTRVEPFSIYEGMRFSFQQWLTDVYFYAIYEQFGRIGITLMMLLEAILMLLVFYLLVLEVSDGNKSLSLLLTFLLSAAASVIMQTRPQITTHILLILELLLLEKYAKKGKWSYLLGLPLCSVLEINLHASMWWMQFVFMLPYLCDCKYVKANRLETGVFDKKPLFICAVVSFAAGWLNPYGWTNMVYLFRSLGSEYITAISEMRPATYKSLTAMYIVAFVWVLLLFYLNNQEKMRVRYFLLLGGTIVLGLVNLRSCVLLVLGGLVACAWTFRDKFRAGCQIQWFLLYLEIFGGCLIVFASLAPLEGLVEREEENLEIVAYLLEHTNPDDVRLYTEYNTGSYYEYAGFHCSIDARMEVFRERMNGKGNYFDEAIEAQIGGVYYKDYLEKYDFDYYVVQKGAVMEMELKHDADYVLLVDLEGHSLYGNAE